MENLNVRFEINFTTTIAEFEKSTGKTRNNW